ncbi:MAG: glycosyltransferase, partial [Bacillota bacterium]
MPSEPNTISLCMIVKDEEKNLRRCLKSVQNCVDEMIVVDTGSSDGTPDIALSFGALIVRSPWRMDFSDARNESLKHATKEWVLFLDADEELPAETAGNLKKLASVEDVEAWTFSIVSPISPAMDSPKTRHLNLRMFRNRKPYRFEGRIHEQIKPSILKEKPTAVIMYSNLEIMHYGYVFGLNTRGKTLRNITILEKELADNPTDPFRNYNIGVSYFSLGDIERSRKHYQIALEHVSLDSGFAAALYRNYCLCLCETGDYAGALELADKGLIHFSDYPDLYFLKGQIFWDLNMIARAKVCFLKCTRFRRTPPCYTITEGVTGHLAFENLAEIHAREGSFSEAVDFLMQAIQEQQSTRLLPRLCSLLQGLGYKGPEIAKYLESNFQLDFHTRVQLLFDAGEFESCLTLIDAAENPPTPESILLKVKCLVRLGRYAEAAQVTEPAGPPLNTEILKQRCLAMWLQKPKQDASALISAFGAPDNPAVIACGTINHLIFGGTGVNAPQTPHPISFEHRPLNVKLPPVKAYREVLDTALEILCLGNRSLALAAVLVCSSNSVSEAYFILGRHALNKGFNLEAKGLLEQAVNNGKADAETYHLLGSACANLNLHDTAFRCFQRALTYSPGSELYAACAIEQLARRCREMVLNGLRIEDRNSELTGELFKLASLIKK